MTPNLNHKQNLKLSIDKILFLIACTYLIAVIFWLVSREKTKVPGMANSSKPALSSQQTLFSDDAKFIAYLQKSLEILERKQQQQQATPKPSSEAPPTQAIKIPPAPVVSNPAPAPQVIEKIYVPVYPQMQQSRQQSPQQPNVAVNPSPPTKAVKPPAPTRVNLPPPPPLPVPSQPQTQPPLAPSTVPVFTPGVSLLPETSASTPSTNSTSLVGLLEAGDKSSALFTINGQTRRIQLGETIGATGWILNRVENQQAIITRNNTVRALQVGQNF